MKISKIKTGNLIWSGIQGESLSTDEKQWIQKEHISGLILFKRNIHSLAQLYELSREIKSLNPTPLLVIDREGGSVDRLKHLPEMPDWPAPEDLAKVCTLEEITKTGFFMGLELKTLGFDVNFAPVWDCLSVKTIPPLFQKRLLGQNPQTLIPKALAFMKGLKRAGLAGVAKHFPGHGGVSEDSHFQLPTDNRTQEEFLKKDLIPFEKAIRSGVELIMTAHVMYPCWDKNCPATFSDIILKNLLRKKMNFPGLIITDDLDMKALKDFSLKQILINLFKADGDIALKCCLDKDTFSMPEWIRETISKKKMDLQTMESKIKKVLHFKTRFQKAEKLSFSQWQKQLVKNSESQLWCRKLNKRLNKQ